MNARQTLRTFTRSVGIPAMAMVLAITPHAGAINAQSRPTIDVDPKVRAELVIAREAVWRAYFRGDSAALTALLPERMTAMGRDRADIIRDATEFKKGGGKYQRMEFSHDQFFVNGDVAIVWSDYIAHLTNAAGKPDNMAGRAIELFVRQHGRWVNPHWHLDNK